MLRRVLLIIVVLILGVASGFWLVLSLRLITLPLAALTLVLAAVSLQRRSLRRWALIAWAVTVTVPLLPVEFTLINVPGPPRFVPLVMGLPNEELAQQCARGDAICGGCIVTGLEPSWVWVW